MAHKRSVEEKTSPGELARKTPPDKSNTVGAPVKYPEPVKPEKVTEEMEDDDRLQATDN
jgi:hypothetical protein